MRNFNPTPWWRTRFRETVEETPDRFSYVRSALKLAEHFNADPRQFSTPPYRNIGKPSEIDRSRKPSSERAPADLEEPPEKDRREFILEYLNSDVFGYGLLKEIGAASRITDARMVLQRFKCPYCDRRLSYRLSTFDGVETAEAVGLSYCVHYFHDIEDLVKGISHDWERNSVIEIPNERFEESFVFICTDCARQVPRALPLSFLSNGRSGARTKWNPFQIPSFPAEFNEHWELVPIRVNKHGLPDITIEYFNLNRPDLLDCRSRAAQKMRALIDALTQEGDGITNDQEDKIIFPKKELISYISPASELLSVHLTILKQYMAQSGDDRIDADTNIRINKIVEWHLTLSDYIDQIHIMVDHSNQRDIDNEISFLIEEVDRYIDYSRKIRFHKSISSDAMGVLYGSIHASLYVDQPGNKSYGAIKDWVARLHDILGRLMVEIITSVLRGHRGSEREGRDEQSQGRYGAADGRGLYVRKVAIRSPRPRPGMNCGNGYRGLNDISFEVAEIGPRPTVAVLADNGCGKTRLLQALVWALAGSERRRRLAEADGVARRYFPENVVIEVEFWGGGRFSGLEVEFGPIEENRPTCERRRVAIAGSHEYTTDYDHDIAFIAVSARCLADIVDVSAPDGRMANGATAKKVSRARLQTEVDRTIFSRQARPRPLTAFLADLPTPRTIEGSLPPHDPSYWRDQAITHALCRLIPKPQERGLPTSEREGPNGSPSRGSAGSHVQFGWDDGVADIRLTDRYGGEFARGVSFADMSDGYRAALTLAILIGRGFGEPPEEGVLVDRSHNGILLIDEIDSSLHPKWRLSLLRRLEDAFPSVQFIFTTHDPLVIRGMDSRNVVRLQPDRHEDGTAFVRPVTNPGYHNLSGLDVEDILLSEYFDLVALYDQFDLAGYHRYLSLLVRRFHPDRSSDALDTQEKRELAALEQRFGAGYAGCLDPRDRIILPAVDLIYARMHAQENAERRLQAIEKVEQLLQLHWGLPAANRDPGKRNAQTEADGRMDGI